MGHQAVRVALTKTIQTNGVSFSLVDGAIVAVNFTASPGYKNQFTISTLNVNSTGAKSVSAESIDVSISNGSNGYSGRIQYTLIGYANNLYFGMIGKYYYPDYGDSD